MNFFSLSLPGAFRIELNPHCDDRGFFSRVFCKNEFRARGLVPEISQINISFSHAAGTVRGFHFQRGPCAESKIVRCIKGAIHDIIVDLRENSPHFGKWERVMLSETTKSMIYVPPGFAHGFQTLVPNTELLYFHSSAYSAEHEGGLAHDDPDLDIKWELPVINLSPRDAALPRLRDMEPLAI